MTNRNISRRTVLTLIGGAGAGFALGFAPIKIPSVAGKNGIVFEPNEFVSITPEGIINVMITRSDMGQGVRTTIAMIVAEELDADWSKVRVIQAGAGGKVAGAGTGGSGTTKGLYKTLRELASGARQMLVTAAAKQWNVDPSTCHTADSKVISASGKSLSYGELTAVAATMAPPTELKLKDRSEFKIIGKPTNRVDNHDVVTGKAMYGLDVYVDGMVFAVISRRPAFGATLKSFDATEAKKIPGFVDTVQLDSGVAVIGTNTWAAMQARDALKVSWDMGPNATLDSKEVSEKLHTAAGAHPEITGDKVVEASYEFPFLAHATMEPMNCVADVKDDSCNIWTGTQGPDSAQRQVSQTIKMDKTKVVVHAMLLGGGFGRRIMQDFVVDAALISQAVKKPVKLIYSRDDDMRSDFYRPAAVRTFKGAVTGGTASAFSCRAVDSNGKKSDNPRSGGVAIPYGIEGAKSSQNGADVPIPFGFWRSVENSINNVAYECFMDELALAAGKDPFEFRKALLTKEKDRLTAAEDKNRARQRERLLTVLETAAEKSGWGKPLPAGHARGIACFDGYGSFAAHVAEVSIKDGKVKVERMTCVVDCGVAINPKGVEAQMQGATIDGLSAALKAAITLNKGQVNETSYFDYDWARIGDAPKTEVHILQGGDNPGGMGEVGYPSVAPAIANAVAALTGKKVRKFPIKVSELV